jgi:group I intron endonuclease
MNYADAGYIYAIKNRVNGHAYVGSTINYKSRWHTHRSTLRRGIHHSFILQKAWDKYGESAFDFQVLLVCPKDQRIQYETFCMPLQEYNVLRTPKESLVRGGWTHSSEFKEKMSALHKGKNLSEEHKAKLSASATGRICDEEFKAKARARQLGISPSNETRRRLSIANTGRIFSEDTIKKLTQAAKISGVKRTNAVVERLKNLQPLIDAGMPISKALKSVHISSATYYKHLPRVKENFEVGK